MTDQAMTHVELFLDVPAELAHEARVLVMRRGADGSIRGAMLEGLRLWVERAHGPGGLEGGAADPSPAEGVTRVYFYADAPAELWGQARALAAVDDGLGIAGAIAAGLRLWVERERARPRPADDLKSFLRCLRLLCCCTMASAFREVDEAVAVNGRPVRIGKAVRIGRAAAYWIMLDDQAHPLSYLNCCAALDLEAWRGREWARPFIEALSGKASDPAAIRLRRERLRTAPPAEKPARDEGEGALYLSAQEERRYLEILGERKSYWRESMDAVKGYGRPEAWCEMSRAAAGDGVSELAKIEKR